jgi:hypothetical protein
MALAIWISDPAPAQQSSHRRGLWVSGRRDRTCRDAIHNGTCQCSAPGILGGGSQEADLVKMRLRRSARPSETDEDRDRERLLLRLRLRVSLGKGSTTEVDDASTTPLLPLPLGGRVCSGADSLSPESLGGSQSSSITSKFEHQMAPCASRET